LNTRLTTVTDWRVRDEDLPDIPSGFECQREIAPQKHVVLRQIVVRHLKLVRLRIGAVTFVPFEICGEDGDLRIYRPAIPVDSPIVEYLAGCGARVDGPDAIRVVAGMNVDLLLRNDRTAPTKPRVSLLVQEEKTP
jgi:hypothetical protein